MKSWPNKLFVGVKKWILLWSRDEFTWKMSSPYFEIRQLFFRRKLRQLYWLILDEEVWTLPLPTGHTLMHSTKALLYFIIDKHKLNCHSVIWVLMMPKCSPVRYTIPALEQPLPENKKTQRKAFKRGVRCGAGQIPSEG